MAQDERIDHAYKIYAITRDGQEDRFVIDGPMSTENRTVPYIERDMESTATYLYWGHCHYVMRRTTPPVRMCNRDNETEPIRYIVVSFEPPGEVALYDKDIHRIRQLTGDEQGTLLEMLADRARENSRSIE